MSSVRPSSLHIDDDDDDWGAISPLPTGTSANSRALSLLSTTSASSSSGESNPFVAACQGEKPHCGTIRHGAKFIPVENTAYILATDNQVLCQPTLSLDEFSIAQHDAFTSEMFSQAEWEQVFASVLMLTMIRFYP